MTSQLQHDDANWLRLSPRSLIVRPVTDLIRLFPLLLGLSTCIR